jgi:Adaptin N terminal region
MVTDVQSALRQAVYLAIKELAATAEDVIMVTASIMKDMQPNSEVIYRPNAIRALCKIIDVRFQKFYVMLSLTDEIYAAVHGTRC